MQKDFVPVLRLIESCSEKKKWGYQGNLQSVLWAYWRSRTLPPLVHDEMFSFCDTLKKTAEHRSQITRTHIQHNQKLRHSTCTTNLLWLRVHSRHSHGTPLTNSTLTSYINCQNLSTWLGSKQKYWCCRVTKGIRKALKSKQGPRIYIACYEGLLLGGEGLKFKNEKRNVTTTQYHVICWKNTNFTYNNVTLARSSNSASFCMLWCHNTPIQCTQQLFK